MSYFLPGDMACVVRDHFSLCTEPEELEPHHNSHWTTLHKGDLLLVVAQGQPLNDSMLMSPCRGVWYLFLHCSTMNYGWHAISNNHRVIVPVESAREWIDL